MSCNKKNPVNYLITLWVLVAWVAAGLFLLPGKLFADDLFNSPLTVLSGKETGFEQKTVRSDSALQQQNLIFRVGNVSFEMVFVEGGAFSMGTTGLGNVTPSSYYIGRTEVTQDLWEAVMGNNPSFFKGGQRPVEHVSWEDCQIFINKLNRLLGKNFRLPAEMEWEYAARGGQNTHEYKYAGSDDLDSVAWYGNNSGGKTHNVGTREPNELGIYDMSGNVGEWCEDCFGTSRVYRGGGWTHYARYCRVDYRHYNTPDYHYYYLGLRLVLSDL